MNWAVFNVVTLFMALTAIGFLIWMLRNKFTDDNPLIEELKEQRDILRRENDALYEKIEMMASSVPHIRLVGTEEKEVETVSPLLDIDEDDNIVGHKGAGVV